MRRLLATPPRTFATVSLALIAVTVVATGFTQSRFFEDALIRREAVIVRDMVIALTQRDLRAEDFDDYAKSASRLHFEQSLSALKSVTGVVRIKVYNAENVIVWSDAAELIGKTLPKTEEHLAHVWAGTASGVFNPADRPSHADERLPTIPLVEFYVPIEIRRVGSAGDEVAGAVAIYRTADDLRITLRRGMLLLWLVSAAGGAVLFAALYRLYRAVYRRQREAETQFARLSTEHGRIVQMEKLSAMGQMVGEIAHQLNNPMVGVLNLAQLAQTKADDPVRVRSLLADIRRAGEHCRGFVQRMLRFTQLARSEPQPTALAALMRDTVEFLKLSVHGCPEVVLDAPAETVTLMLDPVLMRHALFNLLHNAVQADPRGPVEMALAAETRDGRPGWRIDVADHGPGLSADVAQKMFKPFFTTRAEGTGLGLTVVQHIVALHGGVLDAGTNPGGGARFMIWLPASVSENETEDPAD